MEEWQRARLDGCLLEISRSLHVEDSLMHLMVRNIFDINDTQIVQNPAVCRTDTEKRQKIIEIIKSRGADAYWAFCHIVRNKSAQLFSTLHSIDEAEITTICTECINGNDEFIKCSYCKGLVNVLSNRKNGVFIEKPEDIVELFSSTREKLDAKDNECKRFVSEINKLKQEHHDFLVRHVKDVDGLNAKENELKIKEKEYENLLKQKDDMKIENEELKFKIDDLENMNVMQCEEIQGCYTKIDKLQNNPVYENRETIERTAIAELKSKLLQAQDRNDHLTEEIATEKRYSSKLKIKFDSLETVLERQKKENNRVFEDLTNKLDDAQKQNNTISVENEMLLEQVKVSKNEKDEVMKERDHLLSKVYEKDKALKDANLNLCSTDRELTSLKRIHGIQVDRVQQIQEGKDELVTQYKALLNERKELRMKNDELHKARDELVVKLMNPQQSKQSDDLQKQIEECNKLQVQVENWRRKYCMILETRPGDTEVILKRTGKKFGVRFGLRKDPVFLGESKIIVAGIDLNHEVAPLADVEVGDYVISINDVNVQEHDMNGVRKVCSESKENMKLVLRKRRKKRHQDIEINISMAHCERFDELGLKLGVFCLCKGKTLVGFQDLDEIVKVNTHDAETLSIAEMRAKITKILKQGRKDSVIVRRYEWQHDAGRIRSPSQFTDVPVPDFEGISTHSRQSSKLSDSSSLSSTMLAFHQDFISNTDAPTLPRRPAQENSGDTDRESDITSMKENVKDSSSADPPNLPTRGSRRLSRVSPLTNLDYTSQRGDYSYVESCQFNTNGQMVKRHQPAHIYQNELEEMTLEKKEYESFGFQMVGGNKTGIFVSAVDPWRPAEVCGMEKGWRILKINGFSLENVAYCYAVEVLQRYSNDETVVFVFEKTTMSQCEEVLRRKPYDSFHVQTLVSYKARAAGEISFRQGEILCVTNSYVIMEPGQPYKWKAMKEELSGTCQISGLIPRQISPRSPSAIADHAYEEINANTPVQRTSILQSLRGRSERRFEFYYRILEPVGEVLV